MDINGTFFILQLLVLVGTLSVLVMSWQTSRARHSQQTSYVTLASVLGLLALFGMLITVLTLGSNEDADYSLVLGTPALTLVLCGVIVWRAVARRGRRSHRPAK